MAMPPIAIEVGLERPHAGITAAEFRRQLDEGYRWHAEDADDAQIVPLASRHLHGPYDPVPT